MRMREVAGDRSMRVPGVEEAELRPASLSEEFEIESGLVDGGDYAGLHAEGTVETSVIQHVDLSGAKLGPLTLADVIVRDVELSNASLQQVVARRVEWRTCRGIGLKLSVELASDLSIADCRLDYANIHLEKVKGLAVFTGCSFRDATISGNLSDTVFLDCDFVDTEFRVKGATRCDLRTSRIASARGFLTLRGAAISAEQAVALSTMIAAEAGLRVVQDSEP
jgi:uncharacterized protein YjbI with pentapeptide repeats